MRGRQEGGSGWGTHVNPWLIHVRVWQKPLQYCKVISLRLIKINWKKKKEILPHFSLAFGVCSHSLKSVASQLQNSSLCLHCYLAIFPPCMCLLDFLEGQLLGLGSALVKYDLILTNHICKDYFQIFSEVLSVHEFVVAV